MKLSVWHIIGAVFLFVLTNMAIKWFEDNYTFQDFALKKNQPDSSTGDTSNSDTTN